VYHSNIEIYIVCGVYLIDCLLLNVMWTVF